MQQAASKWKPITKFGLVLWAAGLFVVTSYLLLAVPQKVLAGSNGIPPIVTNGMGGSGTLTNPFLVTNCTNLQNITLNLYYNYVLANDIDCSDTINWNNGVGFVPIGNILSQNWSSDGFRGTFDGRGHTISGLYTAASNANYEGLFSQIDGSAHLLNFKITGATIVANANSNVQKIGGVVGAVYGNDQLASISHVSFEGSIISNMQNIAVGGLVGYDNGLSIYTSSARGSIQATDGQVGGLTGTYYNQNVGGEGVRNSFADMDITITHQDYSSVNVGGLIGYAGTPTISSSYSSGSINITGGTHGYLYIGGLVGNGYVGTLTNNLAQVAITLPNGYSGSQYIGGISGTLSDSLLITNYYDQAMMGVMLCEGAAHDQSCTAINTTGSPDPTYFDGNSTNLPFEQWDFTTIWQTTNELPTLRSTITGTTPTVPTNVVATIGSTTTINLSWDVPSSPGSSQVADYIIEYQKAGETTWKSYDTNSIGTTFVLGNDVFSRLDAASQYTIRVVAQNQDGYFASSADTMGHTAIPGFNLVSTCQDLQNMQNDLSANYELTHDIDCSDTINWNQGQGFLPVGSFDAHNPMFFTGVLEGNNYTISNIFTDLTSDVNYVNGYGLGVFGITSGALIQDLRLANSSFTKLTPDFSGFAGSLTGADLGSTFTNVQVTNGDVESNVLIGGLIGLAYNITGKVTRISQSSYEGTIHMYPGGNSHNDLSLGGLIGTIQGYGGSSIDNSFVQADITVDVPEIIAGGLTGNLYVIGNTTIINHSYAAGSLTNTSTDTNGTSLYGGLVGRAFMEQSGVIDLIHSFSQFLLSVASSQSYLGGGVLGEAVQDGGNGSSIITLPATTDAFDADLAGITTCDGNPDNPSLDCLPISGQPNYFYNNHVNPPLDTWDFTNIWQTTSTLPIFGHAALTALTPIPAGRLNPKNPATGGKGAGGPVTVIPPEVPTTNKVVAHASSGGGTTSQNPENKSLFDKLSDNVKQFLRDVPAPILVAFPYVLFGSVATSIGFMFVEMGRQARRLKVLQSLIAKQRAIAQQRDTFWHLAANYLRAPITLLMGGVDLLNLNAPVAKSLGAAVAADAKIAPSPVADKITKLVTTMQANVEQIMRRIEGSTTLQGINWPKGKPIRKVYYRPAFWLPLLAVAGLTLLANYIMHDFRKLNVSTITYATQAMFFVLVAVGLYWILSSLGVVKNKRRSAEAMLAQQTKALHSARTDLVSSAASSLDRDVASLEKALKDLPKDNTAASTLHEGAERLRTMIDSFQLLSNAENGTLSKLSPAGSTSQLDTVLKSILKDEQPAIDSKHLTIDAPKLTSFTVPGTKQLTEQLLGTVLNNAIAFSPSNTTIQLELLSKPGLQGIAIHDHGAGVSQEQLAHMFEPFTKADGDDALRMNHEGLGIDLYLDKLIMQYLGGDITAESEHGKGTTVSLWWPAAD